MHGPRLRFVCLQLSSHAVHHISSFVRACMHACMRVCICACMSARICSCGWLCAGYRKEAPPTVIKDGGFLSDALESVGSTVSETVNMYFGSASDTELMQGALTRISGCMHTCVWSSVSARNCHGQRVLSCPFPCARGHLQASCAAKCA